MHQEIHPQGLILQKEKNIHHDQKHPNPKCPQVPESLNSPDIAPGQYFDKKGHNIDRF